MLVNWGWLSKKFNLPRVNDWFGKTFILNIQIWVMVFGTFMRSFKWKPYMHYTKWKERKIDWEHIGCFMIWKFKSKSDLKKGHVINILTSIWYINIDYIGRTCETFCMMHNWNCVIFCVICLEIESGNDIYRKFGQIDARLPRQMANLPMENFNTETKVPLAGTYVCIENYLSYVTIPKSVNNRTQNRYKKLHPNHVFGSIVCMENDFVFDSLLLAHT